MGNAAARLGDQTLQTGAHCHAPMHPINPAGHPGMPLAIVKGDSTVLIEKKPAATLGGTTAPCILAGCAPGGPGTISQGSSTVLVGNQPLARVNDMTAHSACTAPIPGPVGKILPPGASTVIVGG